MILKSQKKQGFALSKKTDLWKNHRVCQIDTPPAVLGLPLFGKLAIDEAVKIQASFNLSGQKMYID